MGRKIDKEPLAVEQNNYLTKVVNVYIVYDLDAWPRNSTNVFKTKNCLFGVTNVRNIVIKKTVCIEAMQQLLMAQVHGVLLMTLLGML